jgi:hypothetical protein
VYALADFQDNTDEAGKQTVSAWGIWMCLWRVSRGFSTWIKGHIKQHSFT